MKKTKLGQEIIAGLTEAVEFTKGTLTLRTITRELPEEPPEYSLKELKRLRADLHFSQAVMAAYMGVSPATVRSWEQGQKKPTGSARRLMQILAARPQAVAEAIGKKRR